MRRRLAGQEQRRSLEKELGLSGDRQRAATVSPPLISRAKSRGGSPDVPGEVPNGAGGTSGLGLGTRRPRAMYSRRPTIGPADDARAGHRSVSHQLMGGPERESAAISVSSEPAYNRLRSELRDRRDDQGFLRGRDRRPGEDAAGSSVPAPGGGPGPTSELVRALRHHR